MKSEVPLTADKRLRPVDVERMAVGDISGKIVRLRAREPENGPPARKEMERGRSGPPQKATDDALLEDLRGSKNGRVLNDLRLVGCKTVGQARGYSDDEYLRLQGVGRRSLDALRAALGYTPDYKFEKEGIQRPRLMLTARERDTLPAALKFWQPTRKFDDQRLTADSVAALVHRLGRVDL